MKGNTSLTKGWAKDIISPVGCNNLVKKRGYACGAYSGASLHYGLNQIMVVRGGLGVLVGGCLGAGCLAIGMAGFVERSLVVSISLVWASKQSLLRRVSQFSCRGGGRSS